MDKEKYILNEKYNNKILTIKGIIKDNLNYPLYNNEKKNKNIINNSNDINYFHNNNIIDKNKR